VRSSTACGKRKCSLRLGDGTTTRPDLTPRSATDPLHLRSSYGLLRYPAQLRRPPPPSSTA
jgi:hypothetical protein